jgi:hypothetical protein
MGPIRAHRRESDQWERWREQPLSVICELGCTVVRVDWEERSQRLRAPPIAGQPFRMRSPSIVAAIPLHVAKKLGLSDSSGGRGILHDATIGNRHRPG